MTSIEEGIALFYSAQKEFENNLKLLEFISKFKKDKLKVTLPYDYTLCECCNEEIELIDNEIHYDYKHQGLVTNIKSKLKNKTFIKIDKDNKGFKALREINNNIYIIDITYDIINVVTRFDRNNNLVYTTRYDIKTKNICWKQIIPIENTLKSSVMDKVCKCCNKNILTGLKFNDFCFGLYETVLKNRNISKYIKNITDNIKDNNVLYYRIDECEQFLIRQIDNYIYIAGIGIISKMIHKYDLNGNNINEIRLPYSEHSKQVCWKNIIATV